MKISRYKASLILPCVVGILLLWIRPLIAQNTTVHLPINISLESPTSENQSVPKDFVYIKPGHFLMGSSDGDYNEQPVRQVIISKGFYLSDHEVTVGEYRRFVTSTGHRKPVCSVAYENWNNPGRENHPINCVSWYDAQAYLGWLNRQNNKDTYRLPTEAEWEYACKAGTITRYSCGDNVSCLQNHAWYTANTFDTGTKPIKTKQPNPWGLYDMHGNVWEWLSDWYGPYPTEQQTDPQGPKSGINRVLREGSWRSHSSNLRSANRREFPPDYRNSSLGFRVLMMVE